MSLKISKPGMFDSPMKWRLANGLDAPEWAMYAKLHATWAFRVAIITWVIGLVMGHYLIK